VNNDFLVWVPSGRAINPITKTNWEGTGIEPHVPVPQEKALDKAHAMAVEKLLQKTTDERQKSALKSLLDRLTARLAKESPAPISQK
jgi:hypothetical protein